MQVIVTSYRRPKYLRPTLESLRQDQVQLYVVDGGSDAETCDYIEQVTDSALFLRGNPGADVLKNEGVKAFVTESEFLIASDDLLFPAGYSALILDQYRKLNANGLEWTFVACSLPYVRECYGPEYVLVNGVRVRPVGTSQVAGAIVDTAVFRELGGFPVFGRTGQGDHAFSRLLRERGLKMGYLWKPLLVHLGAQKERDYPEYSRAFKQDEDRWGPVAKGEAG